MIKLLGESMYLLHGETLITKEGKGLLEINNALKRKNKSPVSSEEVAKARKGTMTYKILMDHNISDNEKKLKLKFDNLTSHDITYVGIIQTGMASGLEKFPVPYVLTNCHNSLSAVGGTINSDDQAFGLSAAKKYGGIFVPAHQAVIHSYMREMQAGCGKMIMGSDSHTRYGALGTMAVGEGGPEIVKQLLSKTYDIDYPEVVGVYLEGNPSHGVGPQDVALAIIGTVFDSGFVKNAVMEFIGPGIGNITIDFRNGIDVMTTETTCWSTIWQTDDEVKTYLQIHGRPKEYREITPKSVAEYDRVIHVDLGAIKPMISLPFHPSNTYTIEEFNKNAKEILIQTEKEAKKILDNKDLTLSLLERVDNKGRFQSNQGVIAGCSGGTFENLMIASRILRGASIGSSDFALSVYPGSQPIYLELMREGAIEILMMAGGTVRTAFCGPCFGAGDTPANHGFSIRHTTRNFPNREGSKPGDGQIASVALMDARSIAATAKNQGYLTAASEVDYDDSIPAYQFDSTPYTHRVYQGFGKGKPKEEIVFGPNITAWPIMESLGEDLLLKVAAVIHDPVTTTDELMPSGETSSLRSNPIRLSQFTLSRKVPEYLERTKAIKEIEDQRIQMKAAGESLERLKNQFLFLEGKLENTQIGTVVIAIRPGDGSAREQAASGQKVLGGLANIAVDYATKRYRSNLINWGMIPFCLPEEKVKEITVDQFIYVPRIRELIKDGKSNFSGYLIHTDGKKEEIILSVGDLSQEEREIIMAGSLSNYYADSQ